MNLSASDFDWAQTTDIQEKTDLPKNDNRLYPAKDLGEILPFTRIVGIRRLFISNKKLGQISDSTRKKNSGFTSRITFLTDHKISYGK